MSVQNGERGKAIRDLARLRGETIHEVRRDRRRTLCCNQPLTSLPVTDRGTINPHLVTCGRTG